MSKVKQERRESVADPENKRNNKLKSFIELTGTRKKPQNHMLFIVKRKMSSQKNMVQSWFLCCFRFTTQAQLPVQYVDSNGKHLCQSSGRRHTHTRTTIYASPFPRRLWQQGFDSHRIIQGPKVDRIINIQQNLHISTTTKWPSYVKCPF